MLLKNLLTYLIFEQIVFLSKDEFYARSIDEELSKLRAKKQIQDTAKAEGLFPEQPQFQPDGWYNKYQWWWGQPGWQPPMPVSWTPSDPENFEQNIEKANTKKVDMSAILSKLSW